MGTTAIDIDMLNELFDNQKNLDDIFNEDFFLDSSMTITGDTHDTSTPEESFDINFNENVSSNPKNKYLSHGNQRIVNLLVPVILEVAVISYCIMYFT